MLFFGFGVGVQEHHADYERPGPLRATELRKREAWPPKARSTRCTSSRWNRWFRCTSANTTSASPTARSGCWSRSPLIIGFMAMGMKRELVPGRWQMAVEGLTGFIDDMVKVNIGPEGKKYVPYIFSLFIFILVANLLGLLPLAIIPGVHPFTDDQPFQHHRRAGGDELLDRADRRLLAARPSLLLAVRAARHADGDGPADRRRSSSSPSWCGRSASGLRLFVAMIAGHILMEVFGSFIVSGFNGGRAGLGRRSARASCSSSASPRSSCWSARSRPMCSRC